MVGLFGYVCLSTFRSQLQLNSNICQIFSDSLSVAPRPARLAGQQPASAARRRSPGLVFRDRNFNFFAALLHPVFPGERAAH